eukprot:INCI5355.1.p1 GENE.INCI5355.1~~INCI5355.1.p1  ORF type:complete len:385 (+),score=47.70 INCI5355.1:380-1534(+)
MSTIQRRRSPAMACLSARLGALISLVLAWCASCPGRAPFAAGSSAHLPGTARPFQQLDPFEAARVARECLARYSQLAPDDPDYGLETSWAGRVLCNESSPVIAGPLVPKAGSSLLRVLFGDENRPTSLTNLSVILEQRVAARDAAGSSHRKTDDKFWFAIVRDPLSQFVDAYVQASNGIFPKGHCQFTRTRSAKWFCSLSRTCRSTHFQAWLDSRGSTEYSNVHTHRASQMHWLQIALEHDLNALFRLETLEADWSSAAQRTADAKTPVWQAASEWLDSTVQLVKKPAVNARSVTASDDSGVSAMDTCDRWKARVKHGTARDSTQEYYQVLQDNALQHIFARNSLERAETTDVLKSLCKELWLDYACFRYAMPVQCQAYFLDGA